MGTALHAVHNHYLSIYRPKNLTRFDTHKKNELRSLYCSMMQINKEAPWCLVPDRQLQEHALLLKENSRLLHNAIARLGGLETGGLLSRKSAFSSDSEFVSASYTGPLRPENNIPAFEVRVLSLASPQENRGLFLEDARVGLPPETYSFDVAINDMNYEFQFSVEGSESNQEVQERLARLINGADIGLKASVAESEGRTSLFLASESSGLFRGEGPVFDISDDHTSQACGAVAYFGLHQTAVDASNACYQIDGREFTASSNQVCARSFFELQLHRVTPGEKAVRIGLKTDIDSLTDNISQLLDCYNTFIDRIANVSCEHLKSRRLLHEMKGIASIYYNSFASTGIRPDQNGMLCADYQVLHQTAAQSDDISQTFGYITDFAARLLHKSRRISLNPLDYVEKTVVAYKNPGRNFVSPYTAAVYSGMMFNGYC